MNTLTTTNKTALTQFLDAIQRVSQQPWGGFRLGDDPQLRTESAGDHGEVVHRYVGHRYVIEMGEMTR